MYPFVLVFTKCSVAQFISDKTSYVVKSRIRESGCLNVRIALKFDKRLSNSRVNGNTKRNFCDLGINRNLTPRYLFRYWKGPDVYVGLGLTKFTNPTMHLYHILQCSIQNRNLHISVLNGALWDMEQLHFGICEIGLLPSFVGVHGTTMQRSCRRCHQAFLLSQCYGLRFMLLARGHLFPWVAFGEILFTWYKSSTCHSHMLVWW